MEDNYFKFENRNFDFPFYNKNPEIFKFAWLVMLIAFVVGHISYVLINSRFDTLIGEILLF